MASSIRSTRLAKDKTCAALLDEVKDWQAQSGIKLRFIRTDNEFNVKPLRSYCREKGIKLSACAPHVHQQNPIAESSVRMIKRTSRRNATHAKTGSKLHGLSMKYAALQLNKSATSSDPTGKMRSPMTMWPTAPWTHTTQALYPWACLMYGHIGKTTTDPNNAPRARPGLFV